MVNIIPNSFNRSSDEYSFKSGCSTFQFVSLLIQNPQTNECLIVKQSDKYSNQLDIYNNRTTGESKDGRTSNTGGLIILTIILVHQICMCIV